MVLASEQALKDHNIQPLARLVAYSYVGCPPEIMGIGPVSAIENVLKVSGMKLEDIDLIEVNLNFTKVIYNLTINYELNVYGTD